MARHRRDAQLRALAALTGQDGFSDGGGVARSHMRGFTQLLEILADPPAATYVFRAEVAAVSRDLRLLHFRRAPPALTGQEAEVTPFNPFRLALRRLEPLRRLRVATVARVIHNEGWAWRHPRDRGVTALWRPPRTVAKNGRGVL